MAQVIQVSLTDIYLKKEIQLEMSNFVFHHQTQTFCRLY
jgi:hypothetical protein